MTITGHRTIPLVHDQETPHPPCIAI